MQQPWSCCASPRTHESSCAVLKRDGSTIFPLIIHVELRQTERDVEGSDVLRSDVILVYMPQTFMLAVMFVIWIALFTVLDFSGFLSFF